MDEVGRQKVLSVVSDNDVKPVVTRRLTIVCDSECPSYRGNYCAASNHSFRPPYTGAGDMCDEAYMRLVKHVMES